MTDILRIPPSTRMRIMAVRDEVMDKFDVVEFVYGHIESSPPPSNVNILKLPANSQGYLTAVRDDAVDAFDATEFAYDFVNAVSFPEPWGYWKMEEASGNRIDATGHGHDLPVDGGDPGGVLGKVGTCARFTSADGLNYDAYPDPSWRPEGGYTVAFWFKVSGMSDYSYEQYFLELNSQVGFLASTNNAEEPKVMIWAWGESVEIDTSYVYDLNTWYFVVIYWDGTNFVLEVNNVEVGSIVEPYEIGDYYNTYMYGGETALSGCFDEVGIWEICLTPAQRTYLYNSGAGRTLYP